MIINDNWTTCTTFLNANVPKNLGSGLPLPPHPLIDPIYRVCEKWTKKIGHGPPHPLNPKEQLLFFGKPSLKMPPGSRTSVSPPSPPLAWGRRCSYWERSSRPSRPPEPSGCPPSSPAPSPPRGSTGTRRSRRSWPGSRRTWLQSGTRCCQEEPVKVFSEIEKYNVHFYFCLPIFFHCMGISYSYLQQLEW